MRLLFILSLLCLPFVTHALPENEVKEAINTKIIPFMNTGTKFTFKTTDGLDLSAIHFENPAHLGTIVLLPGRSESWLKYGEVFYDLYQKGYSIYSFDERGQGSSPHLVPGKPEIGHVKYFNSYLTDLNTFMDEYVKPDHAKHSDENLYLLAHSMGGAIGAAYLEQANSPFKKAVLCSPMLEINTKPYPEAIAKFIVKASIDLGLSKHYAIGYHDYNLDAPFKGNSFTTSEARFDMTNEFYRRYPETLLGGPSNNWVYQSLISTPAIVQNMKKVETPILMFQAGQDKIVRFRGENVGCANAGDLCTLKVFPKAEHEILMEQDAIRDEAMGAVVGFFK